MIIVMGVLRFSMGLPTIPELMLNTIVRLLGGEAFSSALDNLFYAGRPLLFTLILEGTLLLGVLLGLLYAWLTKPSPARLPIFNSVLGGILYGIVIGVALNVIFLPAVGQPVFAGRPYGIYSGSSIPLWLGLMILALVFGVTLQGLLPRPAAATTGQGSPPQPATAQKNMDRREFVRIGGGTLLALLGGLAFWAGGTILNQGGLTSPATQPAAGQSTNSGGESSVPGPSDTATPGSIAQAGPTATSQPPTATTNQGAGEQTSPTQEQAPPATQQPSQSTSPPANTPAPAALPVIKVQEITPTASFYHVSKNFFDPSPSADSWQLEIKGLVDNPYTLNYKQLTSLPAETVVTGMMCISNPVGGGLIGNARWKGVRLADLLKKANPKAGATKLAMRAVDDYSDSITLQKAMDPDVMLVWEMNGAPLTSQHGFPARLLVPGIYGMKHVKWLTSIELVNYDFLGFWQDPSQGWSDPAPVNTMSRIDFPTDGTLSLDRQALSGIAFAGDRSISKVEVSTDGGKTWKQAYLKPPLSHTAWVVWGYDWTPTAPGQYTVMARATDGAGKVQTPKQADPYPDGATGYHTVMYQVKGGASQLSNKQGQAQQQKPPLRPVYTNRNPSQMLQQ